MKSTLPPKILPANVAFAVGIIAGLPGALVAPQAQRAINENNDAIASAVLTSVDLDYVPAWARPVIEDALKSIDAIEPANPVMPPNRKEWGPRSKLSSRSTARSGRAAALAENEREAPTYLSLAATILPT